MLRHAAVICEVALMTNSFPFAPQIINISLLLQQSGSGPILLQLQVHDAGGSQHAVDDVSQCALRYKDDICLLCLQGWAYLVGLARQQPHVCWGAQVPAVQSPILGGVQQQVLPPGLHCQYRPLSRRHLAPACSTDGVHHVSIWHSRWRNISMKLLDSDHVTYISLEHILYKDHLEWSERH